MELFWLPRRPTRETVPTPNHSMNQSCIETFENKLSFDEISVKKLPFDQTSTQPSYNLGHFVILSNQ